MPLAAVCLPRRRSMGVIEAKDDDPPGHEHGHEEPEEQPTGLERRPDGTIQDAMIRLKVVGRAASHNLENRGHRPLPWSQDGAGHEDFRMLPHGARKDRCKDANGTGKGDRQGEHGHPFGSREHGDSLPINFDPNCDKWTKPS